MSDITALTALVLQRRITELQDDLRRVTAERDHARGLCVRFQQELPPPYAPTKEMSMRMALRWMARDGVVGVFDGPGAAA